MAQTTGSRSRTAPFAERVRRIALGLRELGVARGDRVAILSENRPEWAIADYACLTSGMADVPIYPTLPADRCRTSSATPAPSPIFVSTARRRRPRSGAQCAASARRCRHVITFAERPPRRRDLTLADVEARGAAVDTPERGARVEARRRSPCSRTTSPRSSTPPARPASPKGVMLTHDNMYSNVMASQCRDPVRRTHDVRSQLPPALAHLRAHGRPLPDDADGHVDRLRRVDRHRADQPRRGAADARALGAAPVREDVRPRAGERPRRAAR